MIQYVDVCLYCGIRLLLSCIKFRCHLKTISANHGTGIEICSNPDKTIRYDGRKQIIKF